MELFQEVLLLSPTPPLFFEQRYNTGCYKNYSRRLKQWCFQAKKRGISHKLLFEDADVAAVEGLCYQYAHIRVNHYYYAGRWP